ncbi:unnamed protein product [Aureobasidium mustum]|uniref:RWD domain-containing protein n=1 Tax=Aureobasidium mustum TaxID=2773714 RepID=A0A9N8K746_9PEZI|nr:unnamed protein product [Aureobasidium mustum]
MEGNRERQAAELTLLTTMYPSEFSWRTTPPPDLEAPTTIATDPNFSLTIHPSYALEFSLPDTYPDTQKPHVYLSCGGDVDTSTRKRARAKLAEVVDEQEVGMEMLDLIVTLFTEHLPELTEAKSHADQHQGKEGTEQQHSSKIKRVVIWSHHLLATSKRKDIQAWSKELSLSGFSRPGHPGSIFVEGDEDQVDEFIRRLKQLRWQALQVRGEETADKRICGPGDDADTADLFLQAMKIAKTD